MNHASGPEIGKVKFSFTCVWLLRRNHKVSRDSIIDRESDVRGKHCCFATIICMHKFSILFQL